MSHQGNPTKTQCSLNKYIFYLKKRRKEGQTRLKAQPEQRLRGRKGHGGCVLWEQLKLKVPWRDVTTEEETGPTNPRGPQMPG